MNSLSDFSSFKMSHNSSCTVHLYVEHSHVHQKNLRVASRPPLHRFAKFAFLIPVQLCMHSNDDSVSRFELEPLALNVCQLGKSGHCINLVIASIWPLKDFVRLFAKSALFRHRPLCHQLQRFIFRRSVSTISASVANQDFSPLDEMNGQILRDLNVPPSRFSSLPILFPAIRKR